MKIGGLQKFTLVDYPGKLACSVFISGCPFRCPWCHNPELVDPDLAKDHPGLKEEDLLKFLENRVDSLEGVVLTGGEPTLYPEIERLCRKAKRMGYSVKLDTNGSHPRRLKKLIQRGLVDYVAMDIKGPKEKYVQMTGLDSHFDDVKGNRKKFWENTILENIQESIDILKQNQVEYEFRTTLIPGLLDKQDVINMAEWISPASRFYLQEYSAGKSVDSRFKSGPKEDGYMRDILKAVQPLFKECGIRRL